MKYLVTAVEARSLNKAAELLYTTQPNISKVIQKLETELKHDVLRRSSKGISLTPFGEKVFTYAKHMLKDAEMIEKNGESASYQNLKIGSYPSNMIARNLADFYNEVDNEKLHIEFQEGAAEEVIHWVENGNTNIGIVYIAKKQEKALKQFLKVHDLEFHILKECELCIYAGPNHPYYNRKSVDFEELKNLKFA